ncbi:CAAX protease self-immunity-domain-containing protein [Kockiozyma suomiensis]|uniref:CAAX protease self-immunity-domain-containing protein n=1 Tax=Kockiozyma suomiensis TaxID=1337062 RepID=UPI003343D22B
MQHQSGFTAFLTCTLLTALYVGVLYIHPGSRPSATISRNDSNVIKYRVIAITISTVIAAVMTSWILNGWQFSLNPLYIMVSLRMLPAPSFFELFRSSLLITAILFVGPLTEKLIFSQGWREFDQSFKTIFRSWINLRNYIIGPFTEEIFFRSCIISLELQSRMSPKTAIFVTPLYFGIAHLHHAYESYIQNPAYLKIVILNSLFHFAFTTIFGWYAAFLFMRTGSFWQPFIAHVLCNLMGVPRVGARLEGPRWYTQLYHALLVIGLIAFGVLLGPLTKSSRAIM